MRAAVPHGRRARERIGVLAPVCCAAPVRSRRHRHAEVGARRVLAEVDFDAGSRFGDAR